MKKIKDTEEVFKRIYQKWCLIVAHFLWTKISRKIDEVSEFNVINYNLTSNVAQKPCNLVRNKFPHSLPFDHNRVIISETVSNPDGYINASFINFPSVNRQYILAGEPLCSEYKNFWKMVYEQKSSAIVKLTNGITEDKPLDFETTSRSTEFPTEQGESIYFEDFKVICKKNTRFYDFEIKELEVDLNGDCHDLRLYSLLNWTKTERLPVLDAWIRFRKALIRDGVFQLPERNGSDNCGSSYRPILQCSNDFVRCGAFIITDVLIQSIELGIEDYYSIEDLLVQLRKQRINVWQPTKMINFIYRCIFQVFYNRINCHKLTTGLEMYAKGVPLYEIDIDSFVDPEKDFMDERKRDAFIEDKDAVALACSKYQQEGSDIFCYKGYIYKS